MATSNTSGMRAGWRDERDRAGAYRIGSQLTLGEVVVGCLWVLFFIVASYGATPLQSYAVERWAWLAADCVALGMLLLRPDEMLIQVGRNLVTMSWPILALLSTLWSIVPDITLYQGAQLLLTVLVALCLCATADFRRITILIFIALLATGLLSALVEVANRTGGATAEWRGVFPHKNVLGSMMAVLILVSISLFLSGWRVYISGPVILFALMMLVLSRSGSAIVSLGVVLMLLPLVLALGWGAIAVAMAAGLVLIGGAAFLIVLEAVHGDLLDIYSLVLDALGKDETLTGRTVLWQFADDAINARPWFGYGYKAWWASAETPSGLLRLVIEQDLWYFHNTFLELAVAFGMVGTAVLFLGLGVAVFRSVRAFVRDPDPLLLWPILFVGMSIVYCSVEVVLFANHSFQQFLFVIAAAGMGLTPQRTARG